MVSAIQEKGHPSTSLQSVGQKGTKSVQNSCLQIQVTFSKTDAVGRGTKYLSQRSTVSALCLRSWRDFNHAAREFEIP